MSDHLDTINTEITQNNLNNWNIISLKLINQANLTNNINIWKMVWYNQLTGSHICYVSREA